MGFPHGGNPLSPVLAVTLTLWYHLARSLGSTLNADAARLLVFLTLAAIFVLEPLLALKFNYPELRRRRAACGVILIALIWYFTQGPISGVAFIVSAGLLLASTRATQREVA